MMAAVLVLGRAGPGFGLVLGRWGRGVLGGRAVNGGVGAVDSLRLEVEVGARDSNRLSV